MTTCKTCANAIYDALWGEYKCSIKGRRIYEPEKEIDCVIHKPGTPKESKVNAEYEAE